MAGIMNLWMRKVLRKLLSCIQVIPIFLLMRMLEKFQVEEINIHMIFKNQEIGMTL